jgi:hypothetical protein
MALIGTAVLIGSSASGLAAEAAPSQEQVTQLLRTIDERQKNSGDYHAHVFMEQKEKDKVTIVYQADIYRRSEDQRFMLLFNQPKSEQGKGYLRIDKNLWLYNPTIGKWERRTERERIGGTNSRRADLDESRLAEEYDPSFDAYEKVGAFATIRLRLQAKPNADVAYPIVKLWVDRPTNNILKRQDFALSGRLSRTSYYTKWSKAYSPSKKADVWYPKEIRTFDEIEKENTTQVVVESVDLRPLEKNIFTKAWLERKSR